MLAGRDGRRADLYRQLAALETAGIPLRSAIDKLTDPALAQVAHSLDDGHDPGAAWAASPQFSKLEVALVRAGSKGGQLVESFKALEELFVERARSKRALIAGLAYPVIVLHLVCILPNAKVLFTSGVPGFLKASLIPLAIGYAAVAAAVAIFRFGRTALPAVVDGIWAAIPVVGGLATKRSLSHGIHAFLALYRAGVPVRDAVEEAREASSMHGVRCGFDRIRSRLDGGAGLGEAFLQETSFPTTVREAASTGAATGKLEDTLGGARKRLDEEADQQKKLLLVVLPIGVYLLVAAIVGYVVISFYTKMFDEAFKGF